MRCIKRLNQPRIPLPPSQFLITFPQRLPSDIAPVPKSEAFGGSTGELPVPLIPLPLKHKAHTTGGSGIHLQPFDVSPGEQVAPTADGVSGGGGVPLVSSGPPRPLGSVEEFGFVA